MTALERFAGWLVCGPPGHLVAGAADFAVLLARLGVSAARRSAAVLRRRAAR